LLIEDQVADDHSELTLTISSDPSSASGSAAGIVNQPAFHQNLHIGMVLIHDQIQHNTEMEGSLDASVQDSFLFSKEGTTAWASFFKPTNVVAQKVSVPAQWADFFTAKLLSPEDFNWAKGLLQSKIWQIVGDFDSQQHTTSRDFVLPLHCPATEPPHCSLTKACSDVTQGFSTPQAIKPKLLLAPPASTSVIHARKKARATPMCVSEVRRSPRISASSGGYKAKTCFDKNCLACASAAPPIKKAVVKNLCSKFNIPTPDSDDDSPIEDSSPRQTRSTRVKKVSSKKEINDKARHGQAKKK
jgi:hypothetical protein